MKVKVKAMSYHKAIIAQGILSNLNIAYANRIISTARKPKIIRYFRLYLLSILFGLCVWKYTTLSVREVLRLSLAELDYAIEVVMKELAPDQYKVLKARIE